jgi:hypothetical protein
MKPVRAIGAGSCIAAFAAIAASASGCSHHAAKVSAPKQGAAVLPVPPFESKSPTASEAQVRAQRAWCAYLEALYHRATRNNASWEQLDRCNAELSTASPEMLERTAACSRKALDDFGGDPFTDAYAAEVKRCGAAALEAMALDVGEVEPYVALACRRAATCGKGDVAECQADLMSRFGHRLCLAIGALNAPSRISVRRCLQTAACGSAEDDLSTCLDPMLDKLLWTPD